MTLRIGDDVVLDDGREGQVWLSPHPDDFEVTVAVGGLQFATVPQHLVTVVRHQLPEPQTKESS